MSNEGCDDGAERSENCSPIPIMTGMTGVSKNPIIANYKLLSKNRNVKYSCILKKGKNSLINNEKFLRKSKNFSTSNYGNSLNPIFHKHINSTSNQISTENNYNYNYLNTNTSGSLLLSSENSKNKSVAQRRIYITPEVKKSSKRIIISGEGKDKNSNNNGSKPPSSNINNSTLLSLDLANKLGFQGEKNTRNIDKITPINQSSTNFNKLTNSLQISETQTPYHINKPLYTKIKLAPINLKHTTNNPQVTGKSTHLKVTNFKNKNRLTNPNTATTTATNSVNTTDRVHKTQSNKLYITKSYAFKSKCGSSVKNPSVKKINQDNYLVMPNILDLDNFSIFSIFDGHGLNGHFISEMVRNFFYKYFSKSELFYIPRKSNINQLQTGLTSLKNLIDEKEIYKKLVEYDYNIIKSSFKGVEKEVEESNFDVEFSGSTVCCVFILQDKLICANVGDSRGIMVASNSDSPSIFNISILPVSIDHKPELNGEKERILSQGGMVERINEYGVKMGPYRVWVKDEKYPGLAMSRSIGDFVAKSIGVIPDPEILEFNITPNSKFIVLASDGIWEYMSNEKVAEIVFKYYKSDDVQSAVDELIYEATKLWVEEEKNIDDITVIVIFFH